MAKALATESGLNFLAGTLRVRVGIRVGVRVGVRVRLVKGQSGKGSE